MKSTRIKNLNKVVKQAVSNFKPPERMTVVEWSEKYRRITEGTAEPGLFKVSRTPYFKEPMLSFTDENLHRITVVASSQVGKSEFMLNALAYVMDIDPSSVMFVLPTVDNAEDFSKRRIAPMIRDCKRLRNKVADSKGRDSNNTVLKKSFPGGMLTITGSNAPAALASVPARFVFGDERDRWAESAGAEGDPWGLLEARTTTFHNSMMVEVSTPTIKDHSAIERSYNLGTMEKWCNKCPHCGEYIEIVFKDIKFEYDVEVIKGIETYTIKSLYWGCPNCGGASLESEMKNQPTKWVAQNEKAYEKGHRSFWITAFASPWMTWETIVSKFLEQHKNPQGLKVVYNTILGELWEERGEIESEDVLISRCEDYEAELPKGVLVLTCGVDTQDNRLEYEVVGHGYFGETWGIKRGFIMGRPDTEEIWQRLDDIIDHTYKFKDGKGLKVLITFVDSGGHFTQEVYKQCRNRFYKRVFAIKGQGGESTPYTKPPTKRPIGGNKNITCYLYTIGVDSGKTMIMNNLKIQRAGKGYCHFPLDETKGYDSNYFKGLLSERLVPKRTNGQTKWVWEKIPGRIRNEPLDCRNYALAAFRILDLNLEDVEKRLNGIETEKNNPVSKPKKNKKNKYLNDW